MISLDPGGDPQPERAVTLGPRKGCRHGAPGEALADARDRIVVAMRLGSDVTLLRLRRDLRRDTGFDARLRAGGTWGTPVRLERWRGRGYAVAFTGDSGSRPHGTIVLVDHRRRRRARRRLKVTRSHPTSVVRDLTLDRRGRLIATGQLHDTDFPHPRGLRPGAPRRLARQDAIARRTTRPSSDRTRHDRPRS